jgi:hypothetical protein
MVALSETKEAIRGMRDFRGIIGAGTRLSIGPPKKTTPTDLVDSPKKNAQLLEQAESFLLRLPQTQGWSGAGPIPNQAPAHT